MLGAGKNTVEIVIAAKDRTKAAFAKVNTQMTTMKGGAGRLGGAMNTLKGGISSATSSLGSLGAALGPLGIAVAAAAVVMATLGGAAFKASLEFEKAFATIRVGTGATGEALAGLEGSFKTVFTTVPASTADAATAIADLNTRLGLTGEPLEALATQFLNLSRITGTDVAAAISSATRVMHDFDVSTKNQAGTLDYLFKVSQSTGLGMTQLSSSMTQYGSVMRQMGFNINESAALLGKFEKEGVNLELVLGSLRQGLAKFSKAGEEPVEALQRVTTEIQGMGSVADANALAIETFGARAGPDMAAAIREGRFSIEELRSTLDASSETINKAAADTLQFGDKWTLLKNKVMGAIAPIGDVITNVLGNAMEGLSAQFNLLQTVISTVMNIFKGFFDAINSAVSSALAPLVSKVEELRNKFKEGSEKLTIFSDIITIAAAGAKWLGEKIGILLKMALTPLVDMLKDGIEMLTEFYNKLGPIKDAIGWVGESIHNVAESARDAEPPIKEVEEALEELADTKAPQAIADAWAIAVKAFQDGSGAYKDAVTEINKEVEALKEEWKTATDERKAQIDKRIILIHEESEAVEALNKGYEDHFDSLINDTDKAIEKTKEFIVTIGDTTIEFKGAAAEVLKNADAYEKLQKSAQTLIDLDWSVFTEFEASLPNIEAGIGDMESSFVGLKTVLEDNIEELENVKQSVMDISEIAAPFLEAGFLDGIKAIGNFAGALKDASSAIGDFSSLQDVSIEGCINFSIHVQDMVNALQILEDQMEDLVPSFEKMDSLIDDIAVGFLGGIDINAEYGEAWEALQKQFSGVSYDIIFTNKALAEIYGLTVDEILLLRKEGDLTTFAFMKQTNAMNLQTTQLKKITDALQPYLGFMRTLNELAALSTLSTEKLNNGLNSIKDTLNNLGVALSTFDLRPVMESLFGEETGTTNEFTKTMEDYEGKFSMLVGYVDRFSTSILTLVNSFEALTNISKSVLADQTKLKEVFEGITTVMTNFSVEMGGTERFAQKFATGMDAMLKSAGPLISYFEDNNAAVKQFNTALLSFKTTITTVIDVFEALASVIKRSSELVVISAKDIEDALSLVDDQLIEIGKYLQTDAWSEIVTQLSAVSEEWEKWASEVDNSMPGFNSAVDTFSTLISKILGLSSALKDMRDMAVLSVRDIDEALKNIPVFLDRFVDALALNMSAIKQSLKELDMEWSLHAEEMEDTMPSFTTATSEISTLISTVLSLNAALEELSSMGVIRGREFDRGFSSLIKSISNFAVSLAKNADELIISLQKLRVVWVENEAVLLPLMKDFAIITDNLWGVAHNANRMAEEFSNLSKNSKTLEKGFKSLIDFINLVVKSTKEFYTTEAAAELATFITDVGKVIDAFVDLERDLKTAMDKIKGAISTAVNNIGGKISSLSSLIKSAYEWGANMMGAFITGMDSMSEQLAAAAIRQAGIVEEYLGASSPTKSGPLSHLDEWPRNLVQSYSGGIEAEMHTLNHSFAALAPNMGAAGPASSTKSVNIYLTQNIGNRSDADYGVAQLRREMIRHEVM